MEVCVVYLVELVLTGQEFCVILIFNGSSPMNSGLKSIINTLVTTSFLPGNYKLNSHSNYSDYSY